MKGEKIGCFFSIIWILAWGGGAFGVPGMIVGFLFGIFVCYTVHAIAKKWGYEWKSASASETDYSIPISDKVLEAITKLSWIVIKADECISEDELYVFRDYMFQNFGSAATAEAIDVMRYLQYKGNVSSQEATKVLNDKLNDAEKMQVLQFLFQLAAADGELHVAELQLLNQIADEMQISQTDFTYLKNAYNYMYNRRYSSSQSQNQYSSSVRRSGSMESAYAVLGVKSSDSNEDIKAAYRRLAIANHPDKVQHLGETAHSEAEKRFSQINEAYNKVKKARNL